MLAGMARNIEFQVEQRLEEALKTKMADKIKEIAESERERAANF